jgi:hypothetical protein
MWTLKLLFVYLFSDDVSNTFYAVSNDCITDEYIIIGEMGAVNYFNLLVQHLPGGNKNHKQCKLKLSFLLAKFQMCDLQIMKCLCQPPQHKCNNKYCHKLQWEGERKGKREKEKRRTRRKKKERKGIMGTQQTAL